MIRILHLTLATVLLAGPAFAAPALKPAAQVSSDIVTLGDLVSDAGAMAGVAVFRAPDLGQTGKVSAQDIVNAAAAKGLNAIDTSGLASVSVTRTSRSLTAADLHGPLMAALSSQAGMDDLEAVEVDLDPALATVHLPVDASGAIEVADAVWQRERGTFAATLVVRRADGREERRALTGSAVETVNVVLARQALQRGAVLGPNDVETRRVPKAEARGETLDEATLAVGMEIRRAVREGQPVRAADLVQPTLVKNGANVTILLKSGGLTLTAHAQAMRDGRIGETISVMNMQSKRVLQAVVTGTDQVTVQPPRTLLSAAAK